MNKRGTSNIGYLYKILWCDREGKVSNESLLATFRNKDIYNRIIGPKQEWIRQKSEIDSVFSGWAGYTIAFGMYLKKRFLFSNIYALNNIRTKRVVEDIIGYKDRYNEHDDTEEESDDDHIE